eukprot:m.177001 g.177001  ORF g.177001 m.177001 type:complete len:91 (-) comp14263_c0_seq1:251-523(-)
MPHTVPRPTRATARLTRHRSIVKSPKKSSSPGSAAAGKVVSDRKTTTVHRVLKEASSSKRHDKVVSASTVKTERPTLKHETGHSKRKLQL